MAKHPDHRDNIVPLKRIEGQIRGVQKMIDDGKYCVDILVQLRAVMSAIAVVEEKILEKHFDGCVTAAAYGRSRKDKQDKLQEIMMLIKKFRKL